MSLYQEFSATPVLQIAGAYVANDNVGGLLTFANVASAYAFEGVVKQVVITDADVEDAQFELYFFNADPSATADTDADSFLPAAADLAMLVGVVSIAAVDYVDSTGDSVVLKANVDIHFKLPAGETDLFAVLVATATPTYTAVDDLVVKIGVVRR